MEGWQERGYMLHTRYGIHGYAKFTTVEVKSSTDDQQRPAKLSPFYGRNDPSDLAKHSSLPGSHFSPAR